MTARRRALWLLLPGVLSLVLFADALGNGFVLDDEWIVEKNELIRDLGNLPAIFTSDWWVAKQGSGALYRPLTVLSFALNHAVGGLAPAGYHLVNAVLHAGVSVLLALLLFRLAGSLAVALVAGVFFAVHPIHVEVVANAVGRAELLAAFLVLLTLLTHHRASRTPSRRATRFHLLSLAAFAAALLCKENAITCAVLPGVLDACFPADRAGGRWATLRANARWHAAFLAAGVGYLLLRAAVLESITVERVAWGDNPLASVSTPVRLASAVELVGRYALLLLAPVRLSYDYGPGIVDPFDSPLAPAFLAGVALLVAAVLLARVAWRRSPLAFFLLVTSAATYSIVSNSLLPIGVQMAERLLYLPSVGLLALAGLGLVRLVERAVPAGSRRTALVAVTVLLALPLAVRSAVRVRDWRSNHALFLADADAPTQSSRTHFNAGLMLREDGRDADALARFEASQAIHPTARTLFYVGQTHGRLGDEAARREAYARLAETYPTEFYGEVAAGWLLMQPDENDMAGARAHLERAVALDPRSGLARYNLAVALFNLGEYGEAVRHLEAGAGLDQSLESSRVQLLAMSRERLGDPGTPGSGAAASNRTDEGVRLFNAGNHEAAIRELEAARAAGERFEGLFLALGTAHLRLEHWDEAAEALARGVELYPENPQLLERLAYVEYQRKRYEPALRSYRRLLELRPDHERREELESTIEYLEGRVDSGQ